MDRYAGRFFWKDASKDDTNNAKFLTLLLRYGYKWCQNNWDLRLNLTETDKSRFLKECSESIECLDEVKASITIELLRQQYNEELFRLQNCSMDSCETRIPWFILAYELFYQPSTPEASPISSPSTPSVAIDSNRFPSSVSTLKIADASTSAIASYLSPTPNVSRTTGFPNRERPSFYQEKQLFPSVSPKNIYDNEFSQNNVDPQYNCPPLYPFCILPCASLGRQVSGLPCVQNKNESLFGNGKPVDGSTSFHPRTSDFSYLPSIDRISNRTNPYVSDSRQFQTTNHERNYSQHATSINSMEPIATNFTANNSLTKECEHFTNEFPYHVSFSSSTARTSTSPVFKDMLPTSSGTRTEFRTSPTARTKPSTLLPRRY